MFPILFHLFDFPVGCIENGRRINFTQISQTTSIAKSTFSTESQNAAIFLQNIVRNRFARKGRSHLADGVDGWLI